LVLTLQDRKEIGELLLQLNHICQDLYKENKQLEERVRKLELLSKVKN